MIFPVLLGAWLLLTILTQFPRCSWTRVLRKRDIFALLPNWSFFAPPSEGDIHLLYRDTLSNGEKTAWKWIPQQDRSEMRVLWHPTKRYEKGISNISHQVLQIASTVRERGYLVRSVPYRLLSEHVQNIPWNALSVARGFCLVHTNGNAIDRQVNVVFVSAEERRRVWPEESPKSEGLEPADQPTD